MNKNMLAVFILAARAGIFAGGTDNGKEDTGENNQIYRRRFIHVFPGL